MRPWRLGWFRDVASRFNRRGRGPYQCPLQAGRRRHRGRPHRRGLRDAAVAHGQRTHPTGAAVTAFIAVQISRRLVTGLVQGANTACKADLCLGD
ncbi:hypothetical protein SSCG_00414 [Streptomyces clavuligerus]|nr:hypothetical protein SSCG_00414 [Streptomyces clavuligerus]